VSVLFFPIDEAARVLVDGWLGLMRLPVLAQNVNIVIFESAESRGHQFLRQVLIVLSFLSSFRI
jgi:hypothetical protein